MIEFIITNAATIATLFFFVVFCYVIYYSFKKSNKKQFEKLSKVPMDDDKKF